MLYETLFCTDKNVRARKVSGEFIWWFAVSFIRIGAILTSLPIQNLHISLVTFFKKDPFPIGSTTESINQCGHSFCQFWTIIRTVWDHFGPAGSISGRHHLPRPSLRVWPVGLKRVFY